MLETALVAVHVAAGVTALVLAPVALATRKGGSAHRRWGRVYLWAMVVIFVTSLALLLYRPNPFLLFISVLSFYGAFSGIRVLAHKRSRATWPDWAGAALALTAGLAFIGWGALALLGQGVPLAFALLAVGFGSLLSFDSWSDLRSFQRPSGDRNWWWFYHLGRMIGSYVALLTAFSVQNVAPLLPAELEWVVWVAPTLVGAPLIWRWSQHYRRVFATPARP